MGVDLQSVIFIVVVVVAVVVVGAEKALGFKYVDFFCIQTREDVYRKRKIMSSLGDRRENPHVVTNFELSRESLCVFRTHQREPHMVWPGVEARLDGRTCVPCRVHFPVYNAQLEERLSV